MLFLSFLFPTFCRTGEFTLRVADPQLVSQPETIQVQAVSMQVKYNNTGTFYSAPLLTLILPMMLT